MTTERIDIVVREDGSRVVKRNLEDIGNAADGASDALETMKGIMTALITGAVLKQLADYTGIWTDLTARVARFAGTAANTEAVMNRLMSIAQRTYAPLESTADIYLENAFALQQLGKSAAQSLDYTEAMTNALVVSGAKGQRAESVIRALSKAMLEGKLSGDNWNTVLTQGGRVVEALTQETGKSLQELKTMASAGQLTSDTVFNALINQLDQLREEADDMPATIGDAFIRMRNRIIQVIGEMDQKLGASQGVVKFVDFLNENLEKIIPTLAGIAAAVVVAFAPGIIIAFANQIRGLWVLMAAHPFLAVAAAIAGITTAVFLMRDEISLGIDDTTTLGDLMRALGEDLKVVWDVLAVHVPMVLGFLGEELRKSFTLWTGISLEGTNKQSEGWLGILRTVIQVFDMIGGVIRGTMMGVAAVVMHVINGIIDNFKTLGEGVQSALEGDFKGAWAKLNSNSNVFEGAGKAFSDAFQQEILSQDQSGLEAYFNKLLDRAQEIGKARTAAEATTLDAPSPFTPGTVVDPDAAKKAARELERLKNALMNVLDAADPVGAAMRRLAEAQDILNKGVAAGLITQQQASAAYDNLAELMEDQIDPLRALNREIDDNIELLKMSSGQRQIEAELMTMVDRLRRDGVKLTREETDALRAKLIVEQELARIAQARDSLQGGSMAEQMSAFRDSLEAMKQLLADQSSGFGQGDIAGGLQQMMPWANLEGTQEQMDAYIALHGQMYEQIRQLEEASVINSQTAAQLRMQADYQMLEKRLANTRQFFGTLAQLSTSENKKIAQIGKAAAIVQATIDGVLAVQKTMAETPYPYNIPLAAAQAALAAANVAQIASAGFRTGGSLTVGGSGGPDSQLVAFRATPGEKVQVNTPSQARAQEEGGKGDVTVNSPISVAVVQSKEAAMAAFKSSEGRAYILEVIEEERGTVARAIGVK